MAIKIIKPGKKFPTETRQFTCGKCECVFEADADDYSVSRAFDSKKSVYFTICPSCKNVVAMLKETVDDDDIR